MGITKKWLLSSSLLALTAGTALSGCSSSKSEPNGAASQNASKQRPKITVAVYDRGQMPAGEGDFAKNRWTEWINKNSPVDVQFVPIPRNDEVAKFNTLFASGSAPDLIVTYDANYRNDLYSAKQVIPLDDLIAKTTNYKALMDKYPLLKKIGYKNDGKLYELGRVSGLRVNTELLIRGDWLKKLNLDVPKTPEDLLKVSKAFSEMDPDGNGKKDTLGINLSGGGDGVINAIFGSDTYLFDNNGKLYHDFERAKAATDFKKQLVDAGVVDRDFLTDKGGEKAKQDWLNGKLGIYGVGKFTSNLSLFQTFKKNNPDAVITPIPLPAGPYGQFSAEPDTPAGSVALVNANAKNPGAVLQYVDWLISDQTQKTLKYGVEGENWKMGPNGCPVPIDAQKNKKELDWNFDYWTPFGNSVLLGKCADFVSSLDLNDPIQKELADIYQKSAEVNLQKSRPHYKDVQFMPALPKDVQLISTNGMKYMDLFNKAIVSGTKYTTDQALKDAKAMWEQAGGSKVDDYYTKYYAEHMDKVYLAKKDTYDGF